jgi:hypothetical protein
MVQGFNQMMMKMMATSRISSGQALSCFIQRLSLASLFSQGTRPFL